MGERNPNSARDIAIIALQAAVSTHAGLSASVPDGYGDPYEARKAVLTSARSYEEWILDAFKRQQRG